MPSLKWMVGILVSFWDGLFSGAMLVLGSVGFYMLFFSSAVFLFGVFFPMLFCDCGHRHLTACIGRLRGKPAAKSCTAFPNGTIRLKTLQEKVLQR